MFLLCDVVTTGSRSFYSVGDLLHTGPEPVNKIRRNAVYQNFLGRKLRKCLLQVFHHIFSAYIYTIDFKVFFHQSSLAFETTFFIKAWC